MENNFAYFKYEWTFERRFKERPYKRNSYIILPNWENIKALQITQTLIHPGSKWAQLIIYNVVCRIAPAINNQG